MSGRTGHWGSEMADLSSETGDFPEALLIEHPAHAGDWTVWLAAAPERTFGRYPTREDARRAATRMGFWTGGWNTETTR